MVTLTPLDATPADSTADGVTLTPLQQDPLPETPWHSLFTGAGRTEFEDAPEFGTKDLSDAEGAFSSEALQVFGGYLTTANPKDLANIIQDVVPDAKVGQDRFGNSMVKWRGRNYYVNKPGFSEADAMQLTADIIQFAPVAKVTQALQGLQRYAALALGFGGTQAAKEGASAALGADQDIGEAAVRTGVTALAAPVTDKFAQVVGKALTGGFRLIANKKSTATARAIMEKQGIDPVDVPPQFLRDLQDEIDAMPASARQAATRDATDEAQRIVSAALAKARTRVTGIPKTSAQESGDLTAWRNEQRMREGAFGGGSQGVMQDFDAQQLRAIDEVVGRAQQQVSGGRSRVSREEQAGEAIGEVLAEGRTRMERVVDDAYDVVRDTYTGPKQPLFNKVDMQDLADRLPRVLEDEKIVLTSETPSLKKALEIVQEYTSGADIDAGGRLRMEAIESMRRRVSGLAEQAKNVAERRGIMKMRNAIDEWIYERVDVPEMQAARAARTRLGEAFEPRGQKGERVLDAARQAASDISLGDVRSSQAALNKILGSTGLRNVNIPIIRHLSKTFPDTVPIMKEAAVMRAVYGGSTAKAKGIGIQRMLSNLDDAFEGSGAQAMRELLSPDEAFTLKLLRDDLRAIVPPPNVGNPSGSAAAVADIVRKYAQRFPFFATALLGAGETTAAAVAMGGRLGSGAVNQMGLAGRAATRGYQPPRSSLLAGPAASYAGEELPDEVDRFMGLLAN